MSETSFVIGLVIGILILIYLKLIEISHRLKENDL